jgi:hypothetical protein
VTWVGGTWWELKLAPGWRSHDDPECLTVTKSSDGAFQLSAALKSGGVIAAEEIADVYRETIPPGAAFDTASFGAFAGYSSHYVDGDAHWHKFWLCHGSLLVFATYNGTAEAWRSEGEEVRGMLNSLRMR